MATQITTDDLLEALAAALGTPAEGEGSTLLELCDATGWGKDKVRRSLKALQVQGRLEILKVQRMSLLGVLTPVPGYRVKSK